MAKIVACEDCGVPVVKTTTQKRCVDCHKNQRRLAQHKAHKEISCADCGVMVKKTSSQKRCAVCQKIYTSVTVAAAKSEQCVGRKYSDLPCKCCGKPVKTLGSRTKRCDSCQKEVEKHQQSSRYATNKDDPLLRERRNAYGRKSYHSRREMICHARRARLKDDADYRDRKRKYFRRYALNWWRSRYYSDAEFKKRVLNRRRERYWTDPEFRDKIRRRRRERKHREWLAEIQRVNLVITGEMQNVQ